MVVMILTVRTFFNFFHRKLLLKCLLSYIIYIYLLLHLDTFSWFLLYLNIFYSVLLYLDIFLLVFCHFSRGIGVTIVEGTGVV